MTTSHTPRLSHKVALVTGASRGIGAAVARRYAQEGAHVLLLARDIRALEAVDDTIQAFGGKTTLIPCDLKEGVKIDALAAPLLERFGKIDIFVGNAGVLGSLTPVAHMTVDHFQDIIDVNLSANWRLIRTLDPLLRRAPAGRGIFVTSRMAHHTPAYWGAYGASKAALESLVHSWAQELAKTSVRVNCIDPGGVATDMLAQAYPGLKAGQFPTPDAITDLFVTLAETSCTHHGEVLKIQSTSSSGHKSDAAA